MSVDRGRASLRIERPRALLLATALAAASVGDSADARADDNVDACMTAHVEGQKLRDEGKLTAARERFARCAQQCPALIVRDCTAWGQEAAANQPSIVVVALDEHGDDTAAVRVVVDGTAIAERLGGGSLEIDPGAHAIRFERAGHPALEQNIIVRVGEKNRTLVADFRSKAPPERAPRKVGVPALVAAGFAIASAGVFGGFAIAGKVREKNLASTCAPYCTGEDVAPVKRDYLVADVALGAFAVSTAAFVLLLVTAPGSAPRRSGGLAF